MRLSENQTPSERKKMIAAIVLSCVALIFIVRTFIWTGKKRTTTARTPSSASQRAAPAQNANRPEAPSKVRGEQLMAVRPVDVTWNPAPAPGVGRNIFAYYVPPPPPPKPSPTPTPTPPPPPLIISGLAPLKVYAGTGDFTLEVTGDKFTPDARVFFNDRELSTRYVSAQRLSASVPATLISMAGPRNIVVRTPNGALFSNAVQFDVAAPPLPPYTYVGIYAKVHYNDVVVLKDRENKLHNFQRGDVVGGQWRITNITRNAVEFIYLPLRIKQTLPFVNDQPAGSTAPYRAAPQTLPPRPAPPPPVDKGDDEDNKDQ
jgi:hypothetical protein